MKERIKRTRPTKMQVRAEEGSVRSALVSLPTERSVFVRESEKVRDLESSSMVMIVMLPGMEKEQ